MAVGYSPTHRHGELHRTAAKKKLMESGQGTEIVSTLLNPKLIEWIWGCITAAPLVINALDRGSAHTSVDWRALGLKIALMEDLRETRLTNPTGVNWAWLERKLPDRMLISLINAEMMSFRGTVITIPYLEYCFKNSGGLLELRDERWDL